MRGILRYMLFPISPTIRTCFGVFEDVKIEVVYVEDVSLFLLVSENW